MAKKEKTLSLEADILNNSNIVDTCEKFNPIRISAIQKKNLTILMQDIDGMEACNRFKWDISSPTIPRERIEQMVYWRSALVFFKQGKEFRLLPFVATGDLTIYAFMNKVQPIAYNGGAFDEKNVKNIGGEISINEPDERDTSKGVILWDRQNGYVQSNGMIPLAILQSYIIEEIATRFSYLNINLKNSQGKNIILVKDPKQKDAIEKKLNELYASDKSYMLVKSMFDVQVINNNIDYQEQALWEDITSWNNLRLEHLGITNQGLFNKKERELAIQNMNDGASTEYITDGYYESRKKFVEDVKRVFGDDPDFKEQFKTFDVIDLRVEHKKKQNENMSTMNDDNKDKGDNDNDNSNV